MWECAGFLDCENWCWEWWAVSQELVRTGSSLKCTLWCISGRQSNFSALDTDFFQIYRCINFLVAGPWTVPVHVRFLSIFCFWFLIWFPQSIINYWLQCLHSTEPWPIPVHAQFFPVFCFLFDQFLHWSVLLHMQFPPVFFTFDFWFLLSIINYQS